MRARATLGAKTVRSGGAAGGSGAVPVSIRTSGSMLVAGLAAGEPGSMAPARENAGQLDEGAPSHRVGALLASRWCRLGFGSILVPWGQAQPALQQLVPFRWSVVAAFPCADHPDQ